MDKIKKIAVFSHDAVPEAFISNIENIPQFVFMCRQKNKKAKKTEERLDEDLNPVYGVYYASSGDRIDDGVHEIIDENEYYAT